MAFRVSLISGSGAPLEAQRTADVCLAWDGHKRNVERNLSSLLAPLPHSPDPLARDLLDIASTVYLADIALPRGRNERFVRSFQLTIPVREPRFWREHAQSLTYLLYFLTRDSLQFEFTQWQGEEAVCAKESPFPANCVSLLSGGLDSLAGAVMLLKTGQQPLFVSHRSGNPTILAAQSDVIRLVDELEPGQSRAADIRLLAAKRREGLAFPATNEREPSQRSRSFLFMAAALAAANGLGVRDVYLCENGVLTVALPLSGARIGGQSTRSTHPKLLYLVNNLVAAAGLGCQLLNPFLYQTKAGIIRDLLRPVLAPAHIQNTISCWAAGRGHRQCGGCVPCLLRRLSMLAAGLPDEAYEIDILARPDDYPGIDAYANLVDMLGQTAELLRSNNQELLQSRPELLDLPAVGVDVLEVLSMYRTYASAVEQVVRQHFPTAARLIR